MVWPKLQDTEEMTQEKIEEKAQEIFEKGVRAAVHLFQAEGRQMPRLNGGKEQDRVDH